MRGKEIRVITALLAIGLSAVILFGRAAAKGEKAQIEWLDYVAGTEKMGKDQVAGLIYFSGSEGKSFSEKADALFGSEKFQKKNAAKFVFVKVDSDNDMDTPQKYKVAAKGSAIVILDFEGEVVKKIDDALSKSTVERYLKKAADITKKKVKLLKKLEKMFKKAEQYRSKKKYPPAIQLYRQIVSLEGRLKCDLIDKSKEGLQAIAGVARDELAKVDEQISREKYGPAQRELKRIRATYPMKEILEECKAKEEEIARALSRYKK